MLTTGKMVGFLMTTDYEKARAFFESKLGFEFVSVDQYGLVLKAGGTSLRISRIPNLIPAKGTVLGWEVQNIEAVVTWLKGRGVEFEQYAFIRDKEHGIWITPTGDKVAWFKDPDGNVLSVSEHP